MTDNDTLAQELADFAEDMKDRPGLGEPGRGYKDPYPPTPDGTTEPVTGLSQATVWEQVAVLERAKSDIFDRVEEQKIDLRAKYERRQVKLSRLHHTEMVNLAEKQEQERANLENEFDKQLDELDALLRRAAGRRSAR